MIQLLDTTLRDGSYVTNFQFSPNDTAIIAKTLDEAGIPFIEAGHGLGLNAGTKDNTKAPYPDEAYLEACQHAVTKNRWGMFFIPGIGRKEDIELAAKYGMHFIRIGTNVTEVEEAEPFIRRAKELGLHVASNLMKTYALSAAQVALQAAKAASYGVDIVCVVDSAGGMMREDLDRYILAIRDSVDVDLGFHGHNNLGLGISNALRAVELGCAVVDASVRGLGRSSGNTVTEIFLLTMKRKGYDLGIDTNLIFNLAETRIDSLLKNYQQVDSIGIVSGFAQFHSSFLGRVREAAVRHEIDLKELIVRVSEVDRINAPSGLVESLASEIACNPKVKDSTGRFSLSLPSSNTNRSERVSHGNNAMQMAKEAQSLAKKTNSTSVFNIVQSFRSDTTCSVSNVIYEGPEFVVASAEVSDTQTAKEIASSVDGVSELVLLDIDEKLANSGEIRTLINSFIKSKVLIYSDLDIWADAILAINNELLNGNIFHCKINIIGKNKLSEILLIKFKILGFNATIINELSNLDYNLLNVLIYCEKAGDRVPIKPEGIIIIDAIVGCFSKDVVCQLNQKKLSIIRTDMQIHIHQTISSLVGIKKKINRSNCVMEIDGVEVASDGLVSPCGTVILNSLQSPIKVLGVANGSGCLIDDRKLSTIYKNRIKVVNNALLNNFIPIAK